MWRARSVIDLQGGPMQGHSGPQSLHRQLHNETPVNTQTLMTLMMMLAFWHLLRWFADAALR